MAKADFYINGQLAEKTPGATSWTGEVFPGEYVVEARRKGYAPQSVTVQIEASRTIHAELPRPTRSLESLFQKDPKDQQELDEKKKLKEKEKARAKEVADSIAREKEMIRRVMRGINMK